MHFSLRKMSNKFELLKKLINQAILKKKKKSLKFYLVEQKMLKSMNQLARSSQTKQKIISLPHYLTLLQTTPSETI